MTAYRCTKDAEMLPLLCRTGELQVFDVKKLDALVRMMRDGREFSPAGVIVDLAGFYTPCRIDDMYKVCASMMAGFSHIRVQIISGPFGARRQ